MGSVPNNRAPPTREQLFALAWRIVNPDAQLDSPATQLRMLQDAIAVGAFDPRPSPPPVTEDIIREYRAMIAQWEALYPNQPVYRRYLYQLLDILVAETRDTTSTSRPSR
jgi:hypothetical protein